MKRIRIIAIIGLTVFLTACDVKDPIYETAHPDKGEVTVATDWTATGIVAPPPEGYTLKAGEYSEQVTKAENTLKEYFMPGSYTLYAYNGAAGNISISGTTATADYRAGIPDWFYCGVLGIEVKKDAKHRFTVAMRQQVRELTLVIEPVGGSAERISTMTATLSGVAGSYDMADGKHGSATSVGLAFTKQSTGEYAGKWTSTVRLLGIIESAEQTLNGTITFTDGTPANLPLESELTASLATFNDDKKTLLTLGGTTETPTSAGFTATINAWIPIDGGSVIAN